MDSKLLLKGRAAAEPSVNNTAKGHKVARLRLAVTTQEFNSERYETEAKTTWYTIVFWDDLANLAEKYISKGTEISLGGYPRENEWIGKDGQRRTSTEIHATEFRLTSV